MNADWPTRFIYVCSAGRGAVVNMLPVAHAGIDRVEQVFIFCGAYGPDTDDGNDRAEAVDPALRLARQLARLSNNRLSEAKRTVRIVYGSPVTISTWNQEMRALLADTERPDGKSLPVVLNLKGGTKEMSIGGVLGLSATGKDRGLLVTVSDQYARVQLVRPGRQDILPVRGADLDLPRYLETYGFREHIDPHPRRAHQQRAALEALYEAERDRIQAFARAFLPAAIEGWPLLRDLAQKHADANKGDRDFKPSGLISMPDSRPWPARDQLSRALKELQGFPGIDFDLDAGNAISGFQINTAAASRFLTGGWLEAALYLAVKDALGARNDVSVFTGLAICSEAKPGTQQVELDLAVMIGSQLVIVEAKSSQMTNAAAARIGDHALPVVENNKRMLGGQVCRALIVNPCVTLNWLENRPGAVTDRARRGGIELCLGSRAIDKAVDYIVDIAASRLASQDAGHPAG
nr:DUF1887 family CARF protein [uncultured Rhodopila sp.]